MPEREEAALQWWSWSTSAGSARPALLSLESDSLEVKTMKVTVELSETEMAEILDLTGERKKGPAIRRLMEEALQQRRRAQIAQRFLSGEWGVELESYEADQERERQRDQETAS